MPPRPRSIVCSAVLAALLLLVPGCGPPPSLKRARSLIKEGELASGCRQARRVLQQTDGSSASRREQRLAALRCWIDCLGRSGRLDEATAWLANKDRSEALRRYGSALVALARSPGNLERSVALLASAAGRWPEQQEIAYRAGLLLLADSQARRALPWLQRACRVRETSACRVAEAHALLDLGRRDAALQRVGRVVALEPTRSDIQRGRALVRRVARRSRRVPRQIATAYREALDQLVRHDRPSAAVAAVRELMLDHPDLPALHTLLGLAQLRLGNAAEAIVALRQAIELDSTDPVGHFYLGTIYESRQRWDRSIEHYRRALHFDPFDFRSIERLGRCLQRTGRSTEAARILDRLVTLQGASTRSLQLAASAHLDAGSFDAAVRRLQKLLARSPRNFEAHLRMAQALLAKFAASDDRRLLDRARTHAERAADLRQGDASLEQIEQRLERYGR